MNTPKIINIGLPPSDFGGPTKGDLPSKTISFLEEFHTWNEVTGVPEKGTGWHLELESIFEDADKAIRKLQVERAHIAMKHTRAMGALREELAAEKEHTSKYIAQFDNEQLRAALIQVTAAYDALLKRMGAVREAVGTEPHFEADETGRQS